MSYNISSRTPTIFFLFKKDVLPRDKFSYTKEEGIKGTQRQRDTESEYIYIKIR